MRLRRKLFLTILWAALLALVPGLAASPLARWLPRLAPLLLKSAEATAADPAPPVPPAQPAPPPARPARIDLGEPVAVPPGCHVEQPHPPGRMPERRMRTGPLRRWATAPVRALVRVRLFCCSRR